MAINILVGGEKGGTGKSTIALNLATMFTLNNIDTHLVDCDKQKSSLKFCERRSSQEISPPLISTHLSGNQLHVPISSLSSKYASIIIDCGGQDSVELRSAMIAPCINLMIIPIQACFFDLETLVDMDNLVRTSRIYNPNLVAKCLINRAPSHKKISTVSEAKMFISEELEHLGIFETVIYDRVSYSYSSAKGLSVVEYEKITNRDGKATSEMHSLFKEIIKDENVEISRIETTKDKLRVI